MADKLFQTGQQLRQERLKELGATNLKIAQSQGRTPREKGWMGFGSMIGTAIGGSLGKEPVGMGDLAKDFEGDLSTSTGLRDFQKMLAEAGQTDMALALTPKIKGLQDVEASVGGSSKIDKVTANSDNEIAESIAFLGGRGDKASAIIMDIAENGNATQKARLKTTASYLATTIKELDRDFRAQGKVVSKAQIADMLANTVAGDAGEEGSALQDTAWFWGTDGEMDATVALKKITGARNAVFDKVMNPPKDSDPVVPVPPQETTQAEGNIDNLPSRFASAIEAIERSDASEEEKAKARAIVKEEGAKATDLSQIKPDNTKVVEAVNSLGTNPRAVKTKTTIEQTPPRAPEEQLNIIKKGIASGELSASDPLVLKWITELSAQIKK